MLLANGTASLASNAIDATGTAAQAASAPAPEASVKIDDTRVPGASSPDTRAGPDALETGALLTVNLAAIVKNWKTLAQRVVPAECAAVVKADAYGCGLSQVAAALAASGCRTFFVADLAEARRLRETVADAAIYVLNGLVSGSAGVYAEIDARPVIGSLAEFVEWNAFRIGSGWRGSAALHFDTGMNRLGLSVEDAGAFTARVKTPDHGVALVMSHLACADVPEHGLNAKQIGLFRELRFLFRGIPTSLANSSGIFLGSAAHCDMVRPGAAIYGVNPTPAKANLMADCITLKARIVQLRNVASGDTVGYGATWRASRAARIAVVAAGYADGYRRLTSAAKEASRAHALIAGERCALAGRVSMDLVAFDISALPEDRVRRGDFATLIGEGVSVDEVSQWSGTIGYEVLTGLGRRCRREWAG
jgi:alanine racemase